MLSWVFFILTGTSFFCAMLLDRGPQLSAAVFQGAEAGVKLAVSLAGPLVLWSGVSMLMERTGVSEKLAHFFAPLLGRLYPKSRTDAMLAGDLSANFCANLLGLGNAATASGVRAAKRLALGCNGVASHQLCRLIIMNTASIQLIPTSVAAVRASLGSASPMDILVPVWLTSLVSVFAGLFSGWLFSRGRSDG